MVRLGEWDVASTKEALPYQEVDVENIIIHPGYTPGPLFHDIALLILKVFCNDLFCYIDTNYLYLLFFS